MGGLQPSLPLAFSMQGLDGMFRRNGLSLVLFALFLFTLGGQTLTGWVDHNEEARVHGRHAIPLGTYLASGHFWEATGENWESEFLQMAVFVILTTFLYQQGSAESKRPGTIEESELDPARFSGQDGVPGPVRRGGWQLLLYRNSLGIAFVLLFLGSFTMHAAGGLQQYNGDREAHGQPAVALVEYATSARFWFESFQNWQSEFLSLGVMVVGTIFLRQHGSAESKPVHAPHSDTGKA
jgi:hypothetical protein